MYGCKAVTDAEVAAAIALMKNLVDPAEHNEAREYNVLIEGLEFMLAAKVWSAMQAHRSTPTLLAPSLSLRLPTTSSTGSDPTQTSLRLPHTSPQFSRLSLPSRHLQTSSSRQPAEVMVEVGVAKETSLQRVPHGNYSPLPCPATQAWREARQVRRHGKLLPHLVWLTLSTGSPCLARLVSATNPDMVRMLSRAPCPNSGVYTCNMCMPGVHA